MNKKSITVLFISVFLFVIYYLIFNSDLFIDTVLIHFPSTVQQKSFSNNVPTFRGHLVIVSMMAIFYFATTILLANI